MTALLRIWLALAAILALAVAQTVVPMNWTSEFIQQENTDTVDLSVLAASGQKVIVGPLYPLTVSGGRNIPSMGLSGTAILTNTSSVLKLQAANIAVMSCDAVPGLIDAGLMFSAAVGANVTAVVMYSETSDWCTFEMTEPTYEWVYTMKHRDNSTQLLKELASPDTGPNGTAIVSIESAKDFSQGMNGSSHNGSASSEDGGGPPPSTAVAMVILYAITGIITALFLAIIVTGAVRAHRHPERYGPRNIAGRTRQSRAKGLARAMLETLPIVKFGETDETKPTDVELAQGVNNPAGASSHEAPQADGAAADVANREADGGNADQNPPADGDGAAQPGPSSEDGIAAAASSSVPPSGITGQTEREGCSICAEDFEPGQDQRVLPCNHRFHPACVDPWLLNVSGTCPLCRIDLRPPLESVEGEEGEGEGQRERGFDENGNRILPSTTAAGADDDSATAERVHRTVASRRSFVMGLMGIGRPDRLTREERVLALRQLRGRQLARQTREEP